MIFTKRIRFKRLKINLPSGEVLSKLCGFANVSRIFRGLFAVDVPVPILIVKLSELDPVAVLI